MWRREDDEEDEEEEDAEEKDDDDGGIGDEGDDHNLRTTFRPPLHTGLPKFKGLPTDSSIGADTGTAEGSLCPRRRSPPVMAIPQLADISLQ